MKKHLKHSLLLFLIFVIIANEAFPQDTIKSAPQDTIKSVSDLIFEEFEEHKIVTPTNNPLLSNSLDSLFGLINGLHEKVEGIESEGLDRNQAIYEKKLVIVKSEVLLLNELREAVDAIEKDKKLLKNRALIEKLNNPTDSSTLGFSFVSVIISTFEETIENYLKANSENDVVKKFGNRKESFFLRVVPLKLSS